MTHKTVKEIMAIEDGDIYEFENLLIAQLQHAVTINQFTEVSEALEECLAKHVNEAELQEVIACKSKITKFEEDVSIALEKALALSQKDNSIKALYFEYYYDGAEDSLGNFFLCESYSNENMDWASDFSEVVGDVLISDYFNYDPEIEFDNPAQAYSSIMIANIMLEKIVQSSKLHTIDYPLYFASHDWCGGAVKVV